MITPSNEFENHLLNEQTQTIGFVIFPFCLTANKFKCLKIVIIITIIIIISSSDLRCHAKSNSSRRRQGETKKLKSKVRNFELKCPKSSKICLRQIPGSDWIPVFRSSGDDVD